MSEEVASEAVVTPAVEATETPAVEATESESLWSDDAPKAEVEAPAVAVETPEWFMKDKYKSIEEQAKAYPELLKRVGANWGAPEGDYSIAAELGIEGNDPLLKHMVPKIKDLGLSNAGFNKLIDTYQKANLEMANENAREVKKELTSNDAATVGVVDRWMKDNFEGEDRKTMQSWIMSVGDFKVLNKLRAMIPSSSNVPSGLSGGAAVFETTRDVETEKVEYNRAVKSGEKKEDKNVRDNLSRRFKDAYLRQNSR